MSDAERTSPTDEERWQAEKEEIYAAHAQLIANQRAYHEAEVKMYRDRALAVVNARVAELEVEKDGAYSLLRQTAAERDALQTMLDRVTARVTEIADAIHGDSGWEHDGGCEGDDVLDCFACIEHGLRAAAARAAGADSLIAGEATE